MRFFTAVASAAFAALAAAQSNGLGFTSTPTSAQAGSQVTIRYNAPNDNPVTITLRKGDPDNLQTIQVIAGKLYTRYCAFRPGFLTTYSVCYERHLQLDRAELSRKRR